MRWYHASTLDCRAQSPVQANASKDLPNALNVCSTMRTLQEHSARQLRLCHHTLLNWCAAAVLHQLLHCQQHHACDCCTWTSHKHVLQLWTIQPTAPPSAQLGSQLMYIHNKPQLTSASTALAPVDPGTSQGICSCCTTSSKSVSMVSGASVTLVRQPSHHPPSPPHCNFPAEAAVALLTGINQPPPHNRVCATAPLLLLTPGPQCPGSSA